MAAAAKPDTILAWFRKLVAQKFDGSQHRLYTGRPTIGREITELIARKRRDLTDSAARESTISLL